MTTGKVIIEIENDGKLSSSSELFEVKSRWKKLKSFPRSRRVGSYCTIIGDKLYIICGGTNFAANNNDYIYYDELWIYDINSDTWQRGIDFPGGTRQDGTGFTLNGEIYYGMGINRPYNAQYFEYYSDFWKYNPVTTEWTQLKDSPLTSVANAITFSIQSLGYLMSEQNIWRYDPINDQWTFMQKIPTGDAYPTNWYKADPSTQYNNIGYINFIRERTVIFNPNSSSYFTPIADLLTEVYGDFISVNNQIIFEQYNSDRIYYSFDLNDYSTSQIENIPGENHARGVTVSYNDIGIVGLGYSVRTKGLIRDFYMYDSSIK